MGFYHSDPFLCMPMEKIADMANTTVLGRSIMPPHLSEAEAGHWDPEDAGPPSITVDSHWLMLLCLQQKY